MRKPSYSSPPKISDDLLLRSLRIYERDLVNKNSPFQKGGEYLRDLSRWITLAADRIEEFKGESNESA